VRRSQPGLGFASEELRDPGGETGAGAGGEDVVDVGAFPPCLPFGVGEVELIQGLVFACAGG